MSVATIRLPLAIRRADAIRTESGAMSWLPFNGLPGETSSQT